MVTNNIRIGRKKRFYLPIFRGKSKGPVGIRLNPFTRKATKLVIIDFPIYWKDKIFSEYLIIPFLNHEFMHEILLREINIGAAYLYDNIAGVSFNKKFMFEIDELKTWKEEEYQITPKMKGRILRRLESIHTEIL